ncbi:MAG: hypothetical protein IT304_03860 [Dehalococcoidia bacterium]|nr:hypothetical protein [Dehalococcoidia bacterium]
MRRAGRRLLAGTVAAVALSAAAAPLVHADPPAHDFFWPYGRVSDGGANVSPEVQPILALVNGVVCGADETKVAPAGDPDAGKTVYVVDILADGSSPGQRPGCGHAGDLVTFYFPASGRLALQHPSFTAGPARVDLDLGPSLSERRFVPLSASDGAP